MSSSAISAALLAASSAELLSVGSSLTTVVPTGEGPPSVRAAEGVTPVATIGSLLLGGSGDFIAGVV